MRYTITLGSNLEVVDHNPEMADWDNPRGEVIAEVFHLQATNARGDRRVWGSFLEQSVAEAAIPFAPPVIEWDRTRPEYGSQAWMQYGEAGQIHSESRHLAAEQMGLDTRFMHF